MMEFILFRTLNMLFDLPRLVVEQINFWVFTESKEKVSFIDISERTYLIENASFIEKLAKLGYLKSQRIYFKNK